MKKENVMLATNGDVNHIPNGIWYAQPKLNGIRAIFNPDTKILSSRNGHPINSVPHIIEELSEIGLPLDGEIYRHDMPFQKINGLTRRKTPSEETARLEFHVFDIASNDNQKARWSEVWHLKALNSTRLSAYRVKTELIKTEIVERFFSSCLADGYEGIILRHPMNYYIYERSQGMLKIKPTYEAEAILISFNPTDSDKNQETFGSLRLRLDSGIEFNCSGLTDSDRSELWQERPIGRRITFKYGALSSDGVPVFPRFKAVRWDI